MSVNNARIGVFNMSSHENYFLSILEILEDHPRDVVVFSNKSYIDKVSDKISGNGPDSWVIKSESETLDSFLSRASKIWNNTIDILISFPIYGGVIGMNKYFKLEFDCLHIQLIYNINTWTGSNIRFTPKIYNYLEVILRKRLLSRIDGIIVEYSPLRDYMKRLVSKKNIEYFTPVICKKVNPPSSKYRITVPGHIDPTRRNYGFLLDSLNYLQDHQDVIELHLLGSPNGPEGENIVSRCDRLIKSGWSIRYHRGWVPVEQFEQVLETTGLIVSPIKNTKVNGAVTEIYGQSKGSGCFGDAIRYGKPLVLPDHYQVPPETEGFVRTYSTKDDLAELIRSSAESRVLSQSTIEKFKQKFGLKIQRSRFYEVLSRFYL